MKPKEYNTGLQHLKKWELKQQIKMHQMGISRETNARIELWQRRMKYWQRIHQNEDLPF